MTDPDIKHLTIRLIQARSGLEMELQEQQCFIERARIERDQLRPANVVRDPISSRLLDGMDAVMIGGAGEFSAHKEYEWMPALLDTVRECVDRDIPLFGSCWGHQIIARAMGGTVVHDKERAEMGCGTIELTDDGKNDELLGSYPLSFKANMGHHDRVTELPEGAIELARSATQGNQAFRLKDKPIYGTQFHSELDAARERERLIAYRHFYLATVPDERDFWTIVDSLEDTTEVDGLLNDFLVTFCPPARVGTARAEEKPSH
ncbi:MAG: type 1 glutamine amidotransferase [Rhodothermales bacterium]|nr:type 1 glutamine amidotransferase [Rhodothermales bacterium]